MDGKVLLTGVFFLIFVQVQEGIEVDKYVVCRQCTLYFNEICSMVPKNCQRFDMQSAFCYVSVLIHA